jgi:hypothetical protein
MKNKILNTLTIISMILAFELVVVLATSLYWQHQAVIHHGAFFEANSWGMVSFHWNDVSFAQTPFQDPDPIAKKMEQAFQSKLNGLGIK